MRLIVLMVVGACTASVPADILHLRDGSRYYGRLVSRADQAIVFRIALPDGSSSLVKSFAAEAVQRVELNGCFDAPPAQKPTATAAEPVRDYEQMLREGFELLDDGDLPAALRAMQRAVLGAPRPVLRQLESLCSEQRGVVLDELLATTRVRVAGMAHDGRAFSLRYATPYERAALGCVLQEEQDGRLGRRYRGRTIAQWAAARDQYTELSPDSRQLVADSSRAAALISARLRLDPRLKRDREQRRRLIHLRRDLSRLAARVMAMPGFTAPVRDNGRSDPTRLVAERLNKRLSRPNESIQETGSGRASPPPIQPAEHVGGAELPTSHGTEDEQS